MTYEEIRGIAAMTGLVLFITLFAGVLLYTFWPGNKQRFDRARNLPLEKDPDDLASGDDDGR